MVREYEAVYIEETRPRRVTVVRRYEAENLQSGTTNETYFSYNCDEVRNLLMSVGFETVTERSGYLEGKCSHRRVVLATTAKLANSITVDKGTSSLLLKYWSGS